MKSAKVMAATLALAVSACTSVPSGSVTRLAKDPALTGGTYSTGGGITVASAYREVEGLTALCGLWSESRVQAPYTKGRATDVLASSAAYLDGERLVSGLTFLQKTAPGTRYDQANARCAVTDRAWQPSYANRVPDIRMPRQIVYFEPGNDAGPKIAFRQSGPGALSSSLNLRKSLFGDITRLPLGASPAVGGGRYSSGGGISAWADLRQVGDAAYACGLWSKTQWQDPRTEQQAPEILARATIVADGAPIISDLRFMRPVLKERNFAGKTAHCVDTGRAWADIADPGSIKLRFPNMVVYPGPGARITFTPDGPGA